MKAAPATLPSAVLFDWDNTLVDSWGCIHASLTVTFEAMGVPPWTEAETRARARRSLRDSFPALFGDRWPEARTIYFDHYASHHLDRLRPLPGAEALLDALRDYGTYLAVVSNKTGRFLRSEANALGWTGYFGHLVGAADAETDKPALAPVAMALAPAGLTVESFSATGGWFVGDADVDMECAHKAGCVPVLVGDAADCDFGPYPPAFRFDTCLSLRDLVRRLGDTISVPTSRNASLQV